MCQVKINLFHWGKTSLINNQEWFCKTSAYSFVQWFQCVGSNSCKIFLWLFRKPSTDHSHWGAISDYIWHKHPRLRFYIPPWIWVSLGDFTWHRIKSPDKFIDLYFTKRFHLVSPWLCFRLSTLSTCRCDEREVMSLERARAPSWLVNTRNHRCVNGWQSTCNLQSAIWWLRQRLSPIWTKLVCNDQRHVCSCEVNSCSTFSEQRMVRPTSGKWWFCGGKVYIFCA